MKKVLSLLVVFLIIFNIMVPMTTTNMYNLSISKSLVAGKEENGEEVALTTDSKEELNISYYNGYTLLKSGKIKEFTDMNRIISQEIKVDHNSIYHFKNLSAKYGNCFYVMYDSNREVIDYLRATEETTGEVLQDINIIMPENASYFRVACDLNVNNKMFEVTKSRTESNGKKSEPAIISFIDDDCRSEVYTELYPLIKELELPYTLACPPDSLDDKDGKYMTAEQLKEIYANGIDVVSHHLKEYSMTEFGSIEDYEKNIKTSIEKLNNMGIEVSGVAYPNGRVKDEYMPVVKENFKLGFTTDRGINTLPYESYYIDRCEVFPKNGIYNIDDAKDLVDSVAENGGWLVFMTHCWFETFSSEDLKELVDYIRSKNIEISNVTNVIEKYANPIEKGILKKPLTDMSEDFFVIDCKGRAYTNNVAMTNIEAKNMTIIEKSSIKWEEEGFDYNTMVTILPSGKVKEHFSESKEGKILQSKRNVSDKIYVTPNSTYKFTNLSAKYGNCFYVIYDSNNNVISYQGTPSSSTGETLEEIIITMPSNASYFRVACDLNVNNKIFKVYRASIKDKTITFDANGGTCAVTSADIESKIEELPAATRKGYTFLGWFTDKVGGKQITTETIFETNTTVYAQWEKVGTENLYVSYHRGHTLLKSGKIKEFSDKNRIISEKIYVDSNSVYYLKNLSAKYGNCFYVIYNSNNEVIDYQVTSEESTGEVIESIKVIMPEDASYFRIACDLNVSDKMFEVSCTNIKDKIITFDANGGTCAVTSTDIDSKIEELPVATRKGYTFLGWFTEKIGGKQITTETIFETSTTVYAQWEEVSTENLYVSYHRGYTLLKSGKTKEFSDKNRIISEKIYVDNNSVYYLNNLSAKYGNCFYVIYNSDNEVIDYQVTSEESTGEVIESIKVIMPENASYFRIACDLNVNDKMFTVYRETIKD